MHLLNIIFKSSTDETSTSGSRLPFESNPLIETSSSTAIAIGNNSTESGKEDQQQQGMIHQQLDETGANDAASPVDTGPGLADGFTSWSESLQAFHTAIFHTCIYMTLGVVAFSFLLEHWPILDSLYFSVVLFTTVGYGDIYPDSPMGQLFTIAYAVYGIGILGIFLGIVGEKIMARQQQKKESKIGNARRKYLQTFQASSHDVVTNDAHFVEENPSTIFSIMIDIVRKQFLNIVVLTAIAIPIILLEQWDVIKGLYWMVITATTIGLGDDSPLNPWSKALCILYIPLSVAATGRFMSLIGNAYLDKAQDELEKKFMSRAMTISDLNKIDFNKDGTVSKDEFLIFMLVTLQKVEQEDLDEIVELFHTLDETNDGVITREDILLGLKRTAKLAVTESSPP